MKKRKVQHHHYKAELYWPEESQTSHILMIMSDMHSQSQALLLVYANMH